MTSLRRKKSVTLTLIVKRHMPIRALFMLVSMWMKKKTKTDTQKSPLQFHVQHLLKISNFKSNKNETSKETGIGHFNICELIKPIRTKKETCLLKAKRTFVFIKCKFWKHHRGMVQSKKTTLWCRSCQKITHCYQASYICFTNCAQSQLNRAWGFFPEVAKNFCHEIFWKHRNKCDVHPF